MIKSLTQTKNNESLCLTQTHMYRVPEDERACRARHQMLEVCRMLAQSATVGHHSYQAGGSLHSGVDPKPYTAQEENSITVAAASRLKREQSNQ